MDSATDVMTDPVTGGAAPVDVAAVEPEVADDVLVEDVSIDGMCGVY